MKFLSTAVLAISCIRSTVAFVANSQKSIKTQLNLSNEDTSENSWDHMVGPTMTCLAGLSLASQMVIAAPFDPASIEAMSSEINTTPTVSREDSTTKMQVVNVENSPFSPISGSSIQLADDYLDFSMPSYGDSMSSGAKAKSDSNAPAFNNPFSDSDGASDDKAAAKASKQAEREEMLRRKAEEKAARDAEKAAKEQAAAERKAADEAAAAQKKAEREARREAEKEKQRLAVQRANEQKEEKAAAATVTADEEDDNSEKVSLPEVVPEVQAPDIKVPEFKAPDIKVPEFKAPDFSGFKAPDIPEFKAPDVKVPDVSIPKFSVPKIPDIPTPDTSSISAPSFSLPSTKIEAPKVPSFSTPSFSGSDSGSSQGYASLDQDIVDDQEERDLKAKEARTDFNEADANAREVENNAKKLRAIADSKKKIAKEAKDAACETRFGGKVLCIRPFGVGY